MRGTESHEWRAPKKRGRATSKPGERGDGVISGGLDLDPPHVAVSIELKGAN